MPKDEEGPNDVRESYIRQLLAPEGETRALFYELWDLVAEIGFPADPRAVLANLNREAERWSINHRRAVVDAQDLVTAFWFTPEVARHAADYLGKDGRVFGQSVSSLVSSGLALNTWLSKVLLRDADLGQYGGGGMRPPSGSSMNGDGGEMEDRIRRLEALAKETNDAIGALRIEVSKLTTKSESLATKADVLESGAGIRRDMQSDFRILFGIFLTGAIGLLGVLAKQFKWIS